MRKWIECVVMVAALVVLTILIPDPKDFKEMK